MLDRHWSDVRQVHGAEVLVVEEPGDGGSEIEADALVSRHPAAALSIKTADCAPVAFASPEGVIGAAHAGWRGLAAGVVEATVRAMRRLGATDVRAALGPCIHAECYEFGATDLAQLAGRLGDGVRSQTAGGEAALDVVAAVRATVEQAGARLVHVEDVCTACSTDHWSYRARRDRERQAMVVWLP